MAWLFLRLKLRLIRNRLRRAGPVATVGFIGIWLGALVVGLALGTLGAVLTRVGEVAGAALALAMAGAAWVAGPVVAAALDETIEPRRLELLPISPGQMVGGILTASLVGPGSLATALLAAGIVIGARPRSIALAPIVVLAVTFLLWCLAAARWVTTLLTDLLSTRRGRDLAVLAATGGIVGVATFLQLGVAAAGDITGALTRLGAWAEWTPPGALGSGIVLFARGEWLAGVGRGIYGAAALALVMWGWQRSLARLATRSPGATGQGRAGSTGGSIVPQLLRTFPSPVAAMVGKEFRVLRRDPRFRSQALGLAVALAALGFGIGRLVLGTEYAPFLVVILAWMAATVTGFNQFGMDDRSFWAYLVNGVDLRRVLEGKNLTVAILAFPAMVVLAVTAGLLVGDLRHVPAAIFTAWSVLAIWLAVGNIVSVLGAYPLPESNVFGSRNVSGTTLLASLVGLAAAAAVSAPAGAVVVVALIAGGWWQGMVGAMIAAMAAWFLHRLSLRMAEGLLDSRRERLLELLDRPPV